MRLREIVPEMRGVDPGKMRPMKTLRYPSKDNLQVPAYLTLPEGATGPVPTVVLVHGGPQARDHWAWDSEVQFLAAHGYAVFQPQFRGSTGFGLRFEEAGYGQWGLAMQDDITAGVDYLVSHKIADPDRICIVGASYGGYAALWGLVKTPSLYKCGVSAFGVTDITRLLRDVDLKRDVDLAREYNRLWIGDRKNQDFDAVSPLKHADRIQAPVLIAWGDRDPRVATWHAEDMIAALRKNHKSVRGLEFKYAGHGFWFPDDRRVYYEELLAFLDRNIGPARQSAAASVTAAASAP
jgi:dipeptidyl aminopeptidase/acylaminoacyl peptidase